MTIITRVKETYEVGPERAVYFMHVVYRDICALEDGENDGSLEGAVVRTRERPGDDLAPVY